MLITLAEQCRSLSNQPLIQEGEALLERALRLDRAGPYQLQAAIAVVHTSAKHAEETDWPQIALLYGLLERMHPSAVVHLNRAVAVSQADGPAAALTLLDSLAEQFAD